jgi:hypothetical protein
MGKKSTLTFEQALEDVGLTAKWAVVTVTF